MGSQRPCLALGFADDEVLELEIAKGSADAELAFDAIIKNYSIAILNAQLFVGSARCVLLV